MSEIKAGDLVQVVKPSSCTGGNDDLGLIFSVVEVEFASPHVGACIYCKQSHGGGWYAWSGAYDYPFRRLKRIPPLEELDALDYEHKLDVRA